MTKSSSWLWIIAVGAVALLSALYSLSAILFPFLAGVIGAYALNPIVSRLESWKISRGIGAAFVILAFITLMILLVSFALPFLQNQLILLARSTPRLSERVLATITPLLEKISTEVGQNEVALLKGEATKQLGGILTWIVQTLVNLLSNGMALANILSLVILTPIVMFYLLKDWPHIIHYINSLLPPTYASSIRGHIKNIDETLSSYAQGQALVCLALMVIYATGLWLAGLDQGIFVGILTGFLAFIPYLGVLIGFMTGMGMSFAQFSDWFSIGAVALVFIAGSAIEAYFLTPRLIGDRIGLHPLWIIFALLAGGTWFGFLGILLALPITAIITVIMKAALKAYRNSDFFRGPTSV